MVQSWPSKAYVSDRREATVNAADVVRTYAGAWMQADESARRRTLQAAWADDGTYGDPTALVEGREALVRHIGGFQAQMPAHQLAVTSGVDEHHGFVRFTWAIRNRDGTVVLEGVDFGELADDGRLRRIVGFFGPPPAETSAPSPDPAGQEQAGNNQRQEG
jgi:SnoaL-like domain